MYSKRKARPSTSDVPRPTAIQLPLLPDDSGAGKKVRRSPRLSDGKEDPGAAKRAAHYKRRNLEHFLKRMGYTAEEWELIRNHYLEKPQLEKELRSLNWKLKKERHSGAAVEEALKRQKKLSPDLWLVAFLMAEGNEPKDIPPLMSLKGRRVAMLTRDLRQIVYDEIHSDTDGAVIRWFLGL
jgi:hypothetical protein